MEEQKPRILQGNPKKELLRGLWVESLQTASRDPSSAASRDCDARVSTEEITRESRSKKTSRDG